MTIIDEIRAAIGREAALSAAEATDLLTRLQPEITRCNDRWNAIAVAGPRSANNGPLYRKAILTGTTDEVARLQQEFDQLSIEKDRLNAMRNSLNELRRMMRIREADEQLPSLQSQLVSAIESAEAKQRALEESLDAVEQVYLQIAQARGQLNSGGLSPEPGQSATEDTIGRLLALGPLSRRQRTSMHRDPGVHAGSLGRTVLGAVNAEVEP